MYLQGELLFNFVNEPDDVVALQFRCLARWDAMKPPAPVTQIRREPAGLFVYVIMEN